MTLKSEYLIQVLEKIGVPLLSSIVETSAGQANDEPAGVAEAQRMAELLTRTTQASLEVAAAISPANASQSDAFRLGLAALTSSIIADYYRYDRQVPGEADIKKIAAALQTVVTFSDNFEANESNTETLQSLGKPVGSAGAHAVTLHQILAFTPMINAISSFSFGQNEPKLISDVAQRLVNTATGMSERWLDTATTPEQKIAALEILKALTRLYAGCHYEETIRLQNAGEASGGGLETIWKNFNLRVALLEALASSLLDTDTTTSKSPAPAATAAQAPASPLSPFAAKPAAGESPPAESGGFNPMGGFAKKPTTSPPPPPPAAQPVEKPDSPPSSPMGFFKPPTKKDDE